MAFSCPRCNKSFNLKHHLKQHLLRIKPCEPVHSTITVPTILDSLYDDPKERSALEYRYSCKHCGAQFTQNTNRCRHQRSCQYLSKKKDNEIEMLKRRISVLENAVGTINQTNNIVNNIITNNIVLLDFGYEDLSHITSDFLEYCLRNISTHGLSTLTQKIHFDPRMPQNRNIRMRDVKRGISEVRRDGAWVSQDVQVTAKQVRLRDIKLVGQEYHRNEAIISYDEMNDMSIMTYITNAAVDQETIHTIDKHTAIVISTK